MVTGLRGGFTPYLEVGHLCGQVLFGLFQVRDLGRVFALGPAVVVDALDFLQVALDGHERAQFHVSSLVVGEGLCSGFEEFQQPLLGRGHVFPRP